MQITPVTIPAPDGFNLSATTFLPDDNPTATAVVIDSATAVPQHFYRAFASFLAGQGYRVLTFDYRGIGKSKTGSLRGFEARARDWALKDMAGVVDWVEEQWAPKRHFHVGHSFGGQTLGLLPNADRVHALVTLSAQSGYWGLQGGSQKRAVAFHVHVTLPLLSFVFGYMPWSWVGSAEDLPAGVARDWAAWCRKPGYLLDDPTLPLERYADFKAPVLAYSIDDDDWGTAKSVDAMMKAYPNLTRRHVNPAEFGISAMGHFGFFRKKSKVLWQQVLDWLEQTVPARSTI